MVPVAPIIAGIAFVFTFHMRCISIVRSSYFTTFSVIIIIIIIIIIITERFIFKRVSYFDKLWMYLHAG
jgi:hypothetical protein